MTAQQDLGADERRSGARGSRSKTLDSPHMATPQNAPDASVVRQIDGELFASAFLARVTLARMSLALAVQMNGLGSRLCCSM